MTYATNTLDEGLVTIQPAGEDPGQAIPAERHEVLAVGPSGDFTVGWCTCSWQVLADDEADAYYELSRHAATVSPGPNVARSAATLDAWLADSQQQDARDELRRIVVSALDNDDVVTLGDVVDAHHNRAQ